MAAVRFQLYRRSGQGVLWRFIASNNRDLARSAHEVPDEEAARAGVEQLRRQLGLSRSLTYADGAGRWRWELRAGEARLAQSSRAYHRRIECEATLLQFRETAAAAVVVPGVADFRSGGPAVAVLVPGQRRVVELRRRPAHDPFGRVGAALHGQDMRRSSARSRVAD